MSKASFLNEMLNKLLKKKTLFKSFKNSVDINDNFSFDICLAYSLFMNDVKLHFRVDTQL